MQRQKHIPDLSAEPGEPVRTRRIRAKQPLTAAHRYSLESESGIPPSQIDRRGYFSATIPAQLKALGFSKEQAKLVPALVLPIWGVYGDLVGYQTRPDSPRLSDQGKVVKYETPAGWSMRIDCPPSAQRMLGDPDIPLWITEGIKKADSFAGRAEHDCIIDLQGVWNWRGRNALGGLTALADWEAIAIKGRIIFIAFDNDVMVKPAVLKSLQRLAGFLRLKGARDVRPVLISEESI